MLILDTCALIWLVDDLSKLTRKAERSIVDNGDELFVSAISALEISLLVSKGRIELPMEPFKWYGEALRLHGLREVAVDGEIASLSGNLPAIHKDPCDRIIIATAMIKKQTIITVDRVFKEYPGVKVVW